MSVLVKLHVLVVRFEGGSISHGTPRNLQTESKSLTPQLLPGGRNGDRPTRSPRSQQQSMHSPAMQQSQQQQQQKHQYEKLIEQQQQQQQHHVGHCKLADCAVIAGI